MQTRLLVLLFIIKLKFSRNESVAHYVRRKYDGPTLRAYRRLESTTKKWRKAELDYDFLLYCKLSDIVPNFVKFKLFRTSLYNSEFYKETTNRLLDLEIDHKFKSIGKLKAVVTSLSNGLFDRLTFIDGIYLKFLLNKITSKYVSETTLIHERKLLKLGIHQPKFISPKDVIFNYSHYALSKREEFLLSLGLHFCLPNFKPKFASLFFSAI